MTITKRKAAVPKKDGVALTFLYKTALGRIILKALTASWISVAVGTFLNTRLSKILIRPFVKKNRINLNDYESDNFSCFNDCFCRKIKPELRPFDMDESALAAPCDGLLSVYKINSNYVFPVKQSEYRISTLLRDHDLAGDFRHGYIYIFRLCVNHYHRYYYPADGMKSDNVYIRGKLHTVRPIALENTKVFCENTREYSMLETENFGNILQMEVGAMLVGRIHNLHNEKQVKKGEEKGMFLYGGSTVILITNETVKPLPEFLENTENGLETEIKAGERINE